MTKHPLLQISRHVGGWSLPKVGTTQTIRAVDVEGLAYLPELLVVEVVVAGRAYWLPSSGCERMDPVPPEAVWRKDPVPPTAPSRDVKAPKGR
jgi:hypothetical protein